jgi:HEAT repeats
MRSRCMLLGIVIAPWLSSLAAVGQEPEIVNARLDRAPATAGLTATVARVARAECGPSWIGYAVPAVADANAGGHAYDGWSSCSADLEQGSNGTNGSREPAKASKKSMLIFLRSERQIINNIRVFQANCRIDADGMPVHWLTEVRPSDSVQLLRSYVSSNGGADRNHSRGAAVAAIASTDDSSADAAMQQFTGPSSPPDLRKDAIFWLGAARGHKGYDMLRMIVEDDPSGEDRDRAVFALSVSPVPEAVDALINEARHDASAHVRGQALFWLAQKASLKGTAEIVGATENDPDAEVKKKAVFALTQVPPEQGVPLLIKVAEHNGNLEVRKQAFFWLGQSQDARALDFIARVLTH